MPTLDFPSSLAPITALTSENPRAHTGARGATAARDASRSPHQRRSTADSVAVVQLNDSLWRITRPEGDVLGYIESFSAAGGPRFRAKRFLATSRRFMVDGEFWAIDDALECFRYLAA